MARYTGPVCRLCRREGEKLFLKGQKCNLNAHSNVGKYRRVSMDKPVEKRKTMVFGLVKNKKFVGFMVFLKDSLDDILLLPNMKKELLEIIC